MPVDNELSKQNIQDRYHGRSDPVAHKILNNHATSMGLTPPEDQTIVCPLMTSSRIAPNELPSLDVTIPHYPACVCHRR